MHIRNATANDREAISRVHRASIRALCASRYTGEQIDGWLAILQPTVYDQALREKVFLVAERDGRLLGFAMLDTDAAEVSAIYVSPDAIGSGIGSRLLAELEHRAAEAGLGVLTTHATLNAERFYARHGFGRVGEAVHAQPNGTRLPCVTMTRPLPA